MLTGTYVYVKVVLNFLVKNEITVKLMKSYQNADFCPYISLKSRGASRASVL